VSSVSNSVLVFDMVGTLLDASALDPDFERYFGAPLRREWFSELQSLVQVGVITGLPISFAAAAKAAVKILEERHAHRLEAEQRDEILGRLKALPVFADVPEGLAQLAARGFTLAVLTNSAAVVAGEVLGRAGIARHFSKILSAADAARLKPAPEPYHMAARVLGVEPGAVLMIAAHAWDLAGAAQSGCRTAFLARPGQVMNALAPEPDFSAPSLTALADRL